MTPQEVIKTFIGTAKIIFMSKSQNSDITQIRLTTNTGKHPGRWFSNGKLRGFDFALNNNGKTVTLRILEQNPDKIDGFGNLSKYAILARQGHQICWVIRRDTNTFLGRVQDNEWFKNEPRALTRYRNVVAGAGIPETVQGVDQHGYEFDVGLNGSELPPLPEMDVNDIGNFLEAEMINLEV